MSNATLKIPTPASCRECPLKGIDYDMAIKDWGSFCCNLHVPINNYTNRRHPDCPLKVEEELQWIRKNGKFNSHFCPSCNCGFKNYTPHCPSCGVRLKPPEESEERKEGET